MSEVCRNEYMSRINKVQDYIEEHYFQGISVDTLSEVAGFSKYHFNRVFKGILNESLSQYVNRIRIEHSLFLLAHRLDKNMTDIAYELGYSDSAVFSRAFKNYYGITPYAYRKKYRTECKEDIYISEYNKDVKKKKRVQKAFPATGEIRIEYREEKTVVYIRRVGNYKSLARNYAKLMRLLFDESSKQHLIKRGENEILAMYHDNPEFCKEDQFRTSLCLTLEADCSPKENKKLGMMKLEGGLYAIGHFEIQQEQFEDAWDYMYQKWLITSDYVPRDACPFEVYLNNPKEEENHQIKVDIYVPIEPI